MEEQRSQEHEHFDTWPEIETIHVRRSEGDALHPFHDHLTKSCKWIIKRADHFVRPRGTSGCENELIIFRWRKFDARKVGKRQIGASSPDHMGRSQRIRVLVETQNGPKLSNLGSVQGPGSRNAQSRIGAGIGFGSNPVFSWKYRTAVATDG